MDNLPKLPKGWSWILVSNTTEASPYYAGKHGREEVFRVDGEVFAPVPVTTEAQEGAMETYSTTFQTPDGEIKVTGEAAAVARKYKDGYESIRGELVKEAVAGAEITRDLAQARLANYRPFSGRRAPRQPEVNKTELKKAHEAGPEALAEYLKARGISVS